MVQGNQWPVVRSIGPPPLEHTDSGEHLGFGRQKSSTSRTRVSSPEGLWFNLEGSTPPEAVLARFAAGWSDDIVTLRKWNFIDLLGVILNASQRSSLQRGMGCGNSAQPVEEPQAHKPGIADPGPTAATLTDQVITLAPYFKVHNIDEFKKIWQADYAEFKHKESCVHYAFCFTEDNRAHCREAYVDAAAVLQHLADVDTPLKSVTRPVLGISQVVRCLHQRWLSWSDSKCTGPLTSSNNSNRRSRRWARRSSLLNGSVATRDSV